MKYTCNFIIVLILLIGTIVKEITGDKGNFATIKDNSKKYDVINKTKLAKFINTYARVNILIALIILIVGDYLNLDVEDNFWFLI